MVSNMLCENNEGYGDISHSNGANISAADFLEAAESGDECELRNTYKGL